MSEKGWYSRGYVPHLDRIGLLQSITFRLADSLPREVLHRITVELNGIPVHRKDAEKRKKIEAYMDAGMGCCALRHPRMASVVQESLLQFDGQRYRLLAWCIMPNHVHLLIEPCAALGKIVQSWKSYTARWAMQHNAELELGVPGKSLWMREYWDRYIRDEQHFRDVIRYIHYNPVKAQLCVTPEQWLWSSAGLYNS
ncbi:transposase [Desulfogranum marinum]|uniref:REP-associated tyrosine transposase n=1 Tax=Desulfogranum marinum TaxID=453220 RepID=UPI0029C63FB2|nr:transposase [Desulfogranum marinum]